MIHQSEGFICECSHHIDEHCPKEYECWVSGCHCSKYKKETDPIYWTDKPICRCGHESHEHIAPSDPFSHYVCNGEWSDQGMPFPCDCIKYRETTQNKMWAEQDKETRPFIIKERESLWHRIIEFLF